MDLVVGESAMTLDEVIFVEGRWRKVCIHPRGFKVFTMRGELIYLHRYIFEQHHKIKVEPPHRIIHIDGNKMNNSIANLRLKLSLQGDSYYKRKKLAKLALNQHNDDRNFSPDFFQI